MLLATLSVLAMMLTGFFRPETHVFMGYAMLQL